MACFLLILMLLLAEVSAGGTMSATENGGSSK
jgi:hypothetical protein